MKSKQAITLRGVRQHNLKGFDLEIPRGKLVVITGPSGSGKSTLAFDTIYAEANRRFVESLSPYARQFLEQLAKPDVDSIEGLSPAIAIDQKTGQSGKRASVGTVTEVHDYLRLLFARLGTPWCPKCDKPIVQRTASDIINEIQSLPEGTKVQLLAPVVRQKKGNHKAVLRDLQRRGYVRVWIDGDIYLLEDEIELLKDTAHSIDVVLDRLVIKPELGARLSDSVEQCLKLGEGQIRLLLEKPKQAQETDLLSENFACEGCGFSVGALEPALFSFNSYKGACSACHGLGTVKQVIPELVVPDAKLSLSDGAIRAWKSNRKLDNKFKRAIKKLCEQRGWDFAAPWKELSKEAQAVLLWGEQDKAERGKVKPKRGVFEGALPNIERRYHQSDSERTRSLLEKFMQERECQDCGGSRLSQAARAVRFCGETITRLSEKQIDKLLEFFQETDFSEFPPAVIEVIIREVKLRLSCLVDMGLGYLTLERSAATLSGGEMQRIRLAGQIGSGLSGVLYVLDEPSIGLHPRDNHRLIAMLKSLRDLGNTVIVVEHDRAMIEAADYLIDIGPGAGEHGGEIVAAGTVAEVAAVRDSKTAAYLRGDLKIYAPEQRRMPGKHLLRIEGASAHNLKNISVDFPLGLFICVTGVSGSGKSSLINDTLYPALLNELHHGTRLPGAFEKIEGIANIDRVIAVDQSAIGKSPRSNPATYTGLFDVMRDLFSQLPESKARGYEAGRFSFNVKGGRCERCQGAGQVRVEMHFLPDIFVTCEECNGKQYNRETLEIRYKGLSISEVLALTIEQARQIFANIPGVKARLSSLCDVGLGYLKLGQSAVTLSGGEAQRVKLATELAKRQTGKTLYLLDEPTTGLHPVDIDALSKVLHALVDQGNTVVVIEHNTDLIETADWIVELGPEGGNAGGYLLSAGAS